MINTYIREKERRKERRKERKKERERKELKSGRERELGLGKNGENRRRENWVGRIFGLSNAL